MKYKLYYSIDFLDVICVECFDTFESLKKWVEENVDVKGFEVMDLQEFDEDGYYITDININELCKRSLK